MASGAKASSAAVSAKPLINIWAVPVMEPGRQMRWGFFRSRELHALRQGRGAVGSWRRKCCFGLLPNQGVDEAGARIGMGLPARLQHMAQQEQAGEPKAVLEVLI